MTADFTRKLFPLLALTVVLFIGTGSASATVPFTETFNTNASNWLNGASAAPTYHATGGVGDSGYISYTSSFTSGASGPFGAPPLQILFRGNNANDASGDAFVGNWLSGGIQSFNVAVRHNHNSTLYLYSRIDAGSGAAASLAFDPAYAIAPNTWATISIPLTDSNPPFLSYGAGTFSGVFSNVQNFQLGLYVPASMTFTDLKLDIDNVTLVPEPSTFALAGLGLVGLAIGYRRRLARRRAA